jgi:hypothetical protein
MEASADAKAGRTFRGDLDKLVELSNDCKIDDDIETKLFRVGDLFTIRKKPLVEYTGTSKMVAVVAAKKINNGIKEYKLSDKTTFYGNKIVLVVGGDGGAGMAYYHRLDFMITSSTVVLDPIEPFILTPYTGNFIACELSKNKNIYSRGYAWTNERILDTKVRIPIPKMKIQLKGKLLNIK